MLTGAAFITAGLIQAAISVALYFWGQSVAARRRSRLWWWMSFAPLLALLIATVGGIGTAVGLVRSFEAVSQIDPQHRSQALADSISMAMNLTLFTAVPSWLLYVASLVAFMTGTFLPLPDDLESRSALGSQRPPGELPPPAA